MSIIQSILGGLIKPTLNFMSQSRLPQYEGRLYLQGLQNPVTIHRDKWSIPHLHAQTKQDLFFAQGFVHAQERLFQMELNRRVANGQLSALVGEVALDTDRLARTLGFARVAKEIWQAADETTQADLTTYTAGVNAYLASQPAMPVEFTLLRHTPDEWTVFDTLAFSRVQAWALSHGWANALVRAQLIEALGVDLISEIEPQYAERNPITLPNGVEFNRLKVDGMMSDPAGTFLGKGTLDGGGRGSNGWVISAAKSSTGHAILCNDMHLPVTSPPLWYTMHLRSDDGYHTTGVTLPGLPYVLVGHNDRIAWGATLAFTDTEDLFIEKLDQNQRQYRFRDEWHDLTLLEERIAIKGKADHIEQVKLTHHGPIISDVVPGSDHTLSLNAMALQVDQGFAGFRALNEASDWDSFASAVQQIGSPTLNIVYADVDDNIGYWVSGRVPIRAQGDGQIPAPGWTGDHEWIGEVPAAEMPHALNPQQGYLITCNHRIVDDTYPYFLGTGWMNGYRARRLEDLFTERDKISLEDCVAFQFDVLSLPGRELTQRLLTLETTDPAATLSLDLLRQWDHQMTPDSCGATVYKVLITRLAHIILGNGLGQELCQKCLGMGPHPLLYPANEFFGHWPLTLMRLLDNPNSGWIPSAIGREATLIRGLAETTHELRRLLGDDPQHWQWGQLHQVEFDHSLGAQAPLDHVFNQGPHPIGGDTDTVMQTAMKPNEPYNNNNFSPSYRQIINMGELHKAQAMHPPGQSGHVASPHYGDLIEPWLTGKYYDLTWDEEDVKQAAHHTLTLSPPIH